MLHLVTIADTEPEKLAERIGLAAQPGPTRYLHTPVLLHFTNPSNSGITRGFDQLKLLDEPYWTLLGATNRVDVLATGEMEDRQRPLNETFKKGGERVFASIPGHDAWTFEDPLFQALLLRGAAWAFGQPESRFIRR